MFEVFVLLCVIIGMLLVNGWAERDLLNAILTELKVSNDAFRPPKVDDETRRKMAEGGAG